MNWDIECSLDNSAWDAVCWDVTFLLFKQKIVFLGVRYSDRLIVSLDLVVITSNMYDAYTLYNLYRFVHFSVRVKFLLLILLLQCGKCTYDAFVYVPSMQVDICCFDKTGTLTSDDMVCHIIKYTVLIRLMWFYVKSITNFFLALLQEFCGVVGLAGSTDLEPDMSKVAGRTLEILASCHALVFVDNKLVC